MSKMTDRQVQMVGRWAGYRAIPREVPEDIILDGQGQRWLLGYEEGRQYREMCRTEAGHDPA